MPLIYVFHVAFYALFLLRKLGGRSPAPAAAPDPRAPSAPHAPAAPCW